MHYRNGREAHNGDKVVMIEAGKIVAIGVLYDAKPGNNFCNGYIAPTRGGNVSVDCLCDCLHADDLAAVLSAAGLADRPAK